MDNLRVSNNRMRDDARVTHAISTYNYFAQSHCDSLILEQNDRNDVGFIDAGIPAFSFNSAHNISNRYMLPFNYASRTATGTTGDLADSGADFGPFDVWQMTPGDKLYFLTIDLTANGHLSGKTVWFGINYRMLETCSLQLRIGSSTDNDGSVTEPITPPGVWETKSVMKKIEPSDTSLTISMRVYGGTTDGVVLACPMLAEVGVSSIDAMRII